ncbi:hypothetical protein A3B05_00240 [Candidatus Giovannonibacteria bacterium RIFCSPLOWO2_01_FULL_43_160]|uniref:Uncharacterized protein n=1 Tax=Candidatus Giovannonibacteria bacterium GW2011_GWA2_44_26 TaxID=1618648 RepID=A0A0G1IWT7_9BACT|nr:MAG: hypothetical protein UV72_C0001G0026 [Candidatus Giovannonibacteria bacterium GW2011_GWB1_43_13]KKS99771.1 MAG: hypothetical protein UV75_C0002G0152 [Candidatus Giovannonibacteria bacterium GW2011_GWA1_43_15]KKT63856.1 MAG: hypothetical protein UW55_C0001G0149 [Candidatus Giovannonibacteria bacterium GW2011_GWA2_44_26]OGF72200.1 MAG: hypothetical protein A3E35_01365 [Candidatus Giovannonibacteria bacterium RIFCSPHIGHO2_12_FULL_44_22]OGF76175.1 MAG: hypothetical protein A3B05_00240 [Cand
MGEVVQLDLSKKKGRNAISHELCRFFHMVTRCFMGKERYYPLCKKKPYIRKPDKNGVVRSWHKDGIAVADEERAYEHCVLCYKEEGRCRLFKPKFLDHLNLNVQRSA